MSRCWKCLGAGDYCAECGEPENGCQCYRGPHGQLVICEECEGSGEDQL